MPPGGLDRRALAEIVLAPYYTFLSVSFSLALYPQRSVYTKYAEACDKFQVRPSGPGQVESDSGAERANVIGVDQAAGEWWADDDEGTQGPWSRGERAADECAAEDRRRAETHRESGRDGQEYCCRAEAVREHQRVALGAEWHWRKRSSSPAEGRD